MRHRSAVVLALVVLVAVLPWAPASATPDEEVQLIQLVNETRADVGLPALAADMGLIVAARGHSSEMAAGDLLQHSTRGELASYTDDWELMGENVGRGPNPRAVHEAFLESDSHRSNILGDFDTVGAGVERAPDGTLFVTMIFMRRGAGSRVEPLDNGPMILISGLPEFAVSRLMAAAGIFEHSGRDLCSPVGSSAACID